VEEGKNMKVTLFGTALLAVILGAFAAFGAPGAQAQQNACKPNPSPVNASDPSIIVAAPTAGTSVANPIHVTGQARVFEATVSIKLFDANGAELVSTTTNAAEGGTLSPFSTDVAFAVTSGTPACLWVFEASARDGAPTNVVQIPLTLGAASLPSTGTGGGGGSGQLSAWLVSGLVVAGAGLAVGAWLMRRRAF